MDAVFAALLIGFAATGWWLFVRERRDNEDLFSSLLLANENTAAYRDNHGIFWHWPERKEN